MSVKTRPASLDTAKLIYKCASKKHITIEQDLAHHAHLLAGGEPDPKLDHGGCDVTSVHISQGSAPVQLPACRKCGQDMVLVAGTLPRYIDLAVVVDAEGRELVDHGELLEAIAAARKA